MTEKYTIWILVALIAFVLLKDKLFAAGGVSFAGSAGTRDPSPGPSPSGNTYASSPPYTGSPGPQPPHATNIYDVIGIGLHTIGEAYEDYENRPHR
jgi:hypothetical protein